MELAKRKKLGIKILEKTIEPLQLSEELNNRNGILIDWKIKT
jgi:hypothetical protein